MICVLTETMELAVKIAASFGGIECNGMLLQHDMTCKQKKDLTEMLQRDGFLQGSIYEDICIFIWFESPVFYPCAPNEYAEYEIACRERKLFHPPVRHFQVYAGMETKEKTLRGFLTNRAKFSEVYAICCHEGAVSAFSRMYTQYGMKTTRFRLIRLKEFAGSQEIRLALQKKNLISAPESNLEMMRRKAREDIYWLISANLQLAVYLQIGQMLPVGLKTLCILGEMKTQLTQEEFIKNIISADGTLFGTEKEIASLIKMLEKASLLKRNEGVLARTEKGEEILSLCSTAPEVTDCKTVIALEKKLYQIAKTDLLEQADAAFQKTQEFYLKKTETWFTRIQSTRLIPASCPKCGMHFLSVCEGSYRCSCGLEIPKEISQKTLTEDVLVFLLEHQKTPIYKGSDGKYSRLILSPENPERIVSSLETDFSCPVCERKLRITEDGTYLTCECAFRINTVFYGHRLTGKEMACLLTERKTPVMRLGKKEKPWNGMITLNHNAEVVAYKVEE